MLQYGPLFIICALSASNAVPLQPIFEDVFPDAHPIPVTAPLKSDSNYTADTKGSLSTPFPSKDKNKVELDSQTKQFSASQLPSSESKKSGNLSDQVTLLQENIEPFRTRKLREITEQYQKPCCGNLNIRESQSNENESRFKRKSCCGHIEPDD